MSVDTLYPVMQEMNLPAVPSRLLGRTRRDLNELPPSPPGAALVFLVDGQFHVYDERRRLTGNEDFVTEALAVAVVDLRPYRFSTDLTAHSKHASEDFTIQVTCEAVVDRPELVTRLGALDMPRILADHLYKDREIADICSKRRIDDIAVVRKMVDTRISAYFQHRPLYQPGLQITLHLVDVLTPIGLAERDRATLLLKDSHRTQVLESNLTHERRLLAVGQDQEHSLHTTEWDRVQRHRDDTLELEHEAELDRRRRNLERRAEELEWQYRVKVEQLEETQRQTMVDLEHKTRMLELTRSQERSRLAREDEDLAAERLKQYHEAGMSGLLALAAAQGLITPLDMVGMMRDDEAKALEHIKGLIANLIGEGRADLVSVDLQLMVDTLQEKLLGRLTDRSEYDRLPGARSSGRAITSGNEGEDEDENPPDEDEFH